MSSLGPTSRKTHDSQLVTSLSWVSVFLSVKWGELESAGSAVSSDTPSTTVLRQYLLVHTERMD